MTTKSAPLWFPSPQIKTLVKWGVPTIYRMQIVVCWIIDGTNIRLPSRILGYNKSWNEKWGKEKLAPLKKGFVLYVTHQKGWMFLNENKEDKLVLTGQMHVISNTLTRKKFSFLFAGVNFDPETLLWEKKSCSCEKAKKLKTLR